jgi:TP901 family phage tail tape measure protein
VATIDEVILLIKTVWNTQPIVAGTAALQRMNSVAKSSGSQLSGTFATVKGILSGLGIAVTAREIVRGLTAVGQAAIDFEASFANVRRTVDDLTKTELANLSDAMRQMALQLPINVNELNNVAAAAGQLGIKGKDIEEFTRTVATLASVTNLSTEEAGVGLAQISNIMGTTQDNFMNLANTIAYLGVKSSATESQIVDFGLRLAGAGKVIGLTEAEVLSFGTAMANVGIYAEMGGTAMSRVFTEMEIAVAKGGEQLENFAMVANMSAEEFAKAFKEKPAAAIEAFIKNISTLEERGKNAAVVLEDMGFDGARLASMLLRVSASGDKLTETLKNGAKGWKDNIAAMIMLEKRLQATDKQIELFKAALRDIAISIGTESLEDFKTILGDLRQDILNNRDEIADWAHIIQSTAVSLVESFTSIRNAFSDTTSRFEAFTFGLETASFAVKNVALSIENVLKPMIETGKVIFSLTDGFDAFKKQTAETKDVLGALSYKLWDLFGVAGNLDSQYNITASEQKKWTDYTEEFLSVASNATIKTEELAMSIAEFSGQAAAAYIETTRFGDQLETLSAMQLANIVSDLMVATPVMEMFWRAAGGEGITFEAYEKLAEQIRRIAALGTMTGEKYTGEGPFLPEPGGAGAGGKDKERERIEKLTQAFRDQMLPLDALQAEYADLAKGGVTLTEFMKVYGEEVLQAAVDQEHFNGVLDKTDQEFADAADATRQYIEELRAYDLAREALTESNQKAVEENNNLANAQDRINEILRTSYDDVSALQEAIDFYDTSVNGLNPNLQEYVDKLILARDVAQAHATAQYEMALAAKEAADAFQEEMQALEGIGKFLGFLSGVAGNFSAVMGDIINSVQGGVNVFQDMREKGFSKTEAAIGGVGAALQNLGSQFDNVLGKALQAAGAIAQAWAQGGPVAAAITAATIAFSALLSLFGHDWGKDVNKQLDILIDGLKISEELMEQITDDAKEMGNAMAASLIHLPDIFEELGVTMENFATLTGSVMDVFSGVEQGIIDAAQANEILADTFPQLLDAALRFGDAYMDQLKQIVATAAATGIGTDVIANALQEAMDTIERQIMDASKGLLQALEPMIAQLGTSVADFFAEMIPAAALDATNAFKTLSEEQVKTFNEMIAKGMSFTQIMDEMGLSVTQVAEIFRTLGNGMIPVTEEFENLKETAQGLATIVMTSFNAMIEAGASLSEALTAIGPNMDSLREIFKALHLSFADIGMGWLNQMEQINSKFPEQIAAIDGVIQALEMMNSIGLKPNQKQFLALQNTAVASFNKINKDGKASKAELASMAPVLSQLAQNAARYGYALDPAVQELINMARQHGIVIETDPAPTLEDTMTSLLEVLADIKEMLAALATGATEFGTALDDATVDRDVTVTVAYDAGPMPDIIDSTTGGNAGCPSGYRYDKNQKKCVKRRWQSFAGLSGWHHVTSEQLYLLHPGELIGGKNVTTEGAGGCAGCKEGRMWSAGGNMTIQKGAIVINGAGLNERQLTQAVINGIRKAGPLAELRRKTS